MTVSPASPNKNHFIPGMHPGNPRHIQQQLIHTYAPNHIRPAAVHQRTCVKVLHENEAAGYGLAFKAERDMVIAVVSIGYADGIPRELSMCKASTTA